MKFWILILVPTLLLFTATEIPAHNLVTVNGQGQGQGHQHVYRRQQYGKPLQQGNFSQTPGRSSMIIWGSGSQSGYGKLNARRDGPIINDQQPWKDRKSNGKMKFGATIKNYGKPRPKYGSQR